MKVVDLNLLLYAINADAPHHARACTWWEEALGGDEPVGLSWTVILGFLRLTTRAGLFPRPLTCAEALEVVGEWLRHPAVILLHAGERHWAILSELLAGVGMAGNLTTDAHLAALAMEYDGTLFSSDHDFVRFRPALKSVNPLIQE
jgi:toxin-antitoxin system PIN domain toxin